MKRLFICLVLILGLTNTTFSIGNGYNTYHISSPIPTVKDIAIHPYRNEDITFVNGLYIISQRVDVKYESPVTGNVIFKCELMNTYTKTEFSVLVPKFVNSGLNDLKDFYMLPSYYCQATEINNLMAWKNYFNVITIENILPGGN